MKQAEFVKIGIGVAVAYLLLKKQAETRIRGIGRSDRPIRYDSYQIKPGGRIEEYWGKVKPNARKMGVEPATGTHYLDTQEAVEQFGLYGIEYGNWLNQQDRADFLFGLTVSLADMARVLGVKQSNMGLGKRLEFALGARGKTAAAAHFEPLHLSINLTKESGKGSLSHEFGHAIDFQGGMAAGIRGFLSEGRSTRKQPDYTNRPPNTPAFWMEKALDKILWQDNGRPSSYNKWLEGQTTYFNRRTEIFARMTERLFYTLFKDKGVHNSFAVDSRPTSDWPSEDLILKAKPYMLKIFKYVLSKT